MKITWLGHSAFRVDLRDFPYRLIVFFLTGNAKFTGSLDSGRGGRHRYRAHPRA